MNTQILITEGKRFFGPLLCLVAGYTTFACLRFTTLLILTWHWGLTTPPRVSYISGGLLVMAALAATWLCGFFVWLGWHWFRTPGSRCSHSKGLGNPEKNLPEAKVSPVAKPRLRAQSSPLFRRVGRFSSADAGRVVDRAWLSFGG